MSEKEFADSEPGSERAAQTLNISVTQRAHLGTGANSNAAHLSQLRSPASVSHSVPITPKKT